MRPLNRLSAPLLTALIGGPATALAQGIDLDVLAPAATSSGDFIGHAVDVSGPRAIVGGYAHDFEGTSTTGGAWIYERVDGAWSETVRLQPSDLPPSCRFGYAVGIAGDFAAVGAYRDDTTANDLGAVYVFERQGDGTWVELQKLTPSDGDAGWEFGIALDLDGDRMLVGAPGARLTGSTSRTGAGYLFQWNNEDAWIEVEKLETDDSLGNDELGDAVGLDGDRAVLGAPLQDDNGNSSGAAYVFERQSTFIWTFDQKLLAFDGASSDRFGSSVDVEGDVVAVGSPFDDDNGTSTGAVYVFEQDGADWQFEEKLLSSTRDSGARFGDALDLDDDALLVGAQFERVGFASDAGAAYAFSRDAQGAYVERERLTWASPSGNDRFGTSVALELGTGLIGSPLNADSVGDGGLSQLFYVQAADPDVVAVGSGSPGCDGPSSLALAHPALVGSAAFGLTCDAAPVSSVGFLYIGNGPNPAGLDIGLGALVHIDLFAPGPLLDLPIVSDASGVGGAPLPLPPNPNLAGVRFTAQAFWLWTSCVLPPIGLSSSNGLVFEVRL
ncbi:MAG: FG-GAP repeat protein [Planctomycetota bacterium]